MKAISKNLVWLLCTVLLCSNCAASRKTTAYKGDISRSFNVENFSIILNRGVGNIHIVQTSGKYYMKVVGSERWINRVRAIVSGNMLSVGLEPINYDNGRISMKADDITINKVATVANLYDDENHINLKIEIGLPYLNKLESRGVGDITIDDFRQKDLSIESRGVGNIDINRLKVNELSVESRGVGNITVGGKANMITLINRGVGNVNTVDLNAETVNAECRGIGNIDCFVSGTINAEVSGMGNIKYKGNPFHKNVNVSGKMGHVERY